MDELKILLDTSALLLFYEGVDVLEELSKALPGKVKYCTLDVIVEELKTLSRRGGSRRGRAARFVLSNIIKYVEIINTGFKDLRADDAIIEFIKENPDYAVVTLDNDLKRKLREHGAKVLTWWHGRRRFVGVE